MKIKHLISCLGLSGILLGCIQEPEFESIEEGGLSINIDGSISQISTKVNSQGFEHLDALALYAVNYEEGNQTPGKLLSEGNQVDHVKYVFDEASWKWTPNRNVYYKDVNTNVDLYAFYPYDEPRDVSEYNFEVQKDQSIGRVAGNLSGYEASDFLWGKATNIAPTESAIKIKLEHKMAGVLVTLNEGSGFEEAGDWDLVSKQVLVTGTTRKASIDIATGEVTPVGTAQSAGILMASQTDGGFRAVVVPQTVDAGIPMFNILVEGVTYRLSKDVRYTFVPGKLNKFTITINRKSPSGEYEFILSEASIIDWREDLNTHEGTARQYYCVNCSEPGTLGRLIKEDKKNPDKIKNLKVSGKISDEDFYFMRDSMAILEAANLMDCKLVDVCYTYIKTNHDGSMEFETRIADNIIPDGAFQDKRSLYYVTLPKEITDIGPNAFNGSSISGTLVIPDAVKVIGYAAFSGTNITGVDFPSNLNYIGDYCFSRCSSLSGSLNFPGTLQYIGSFAFTECPLTGSLVLPESLSYLGRNAFEYAGPFKGGLKIPDKISEIFESTFRNCGFTGVLDLNNVKRIEDLAFEQDGFQGELLIPEGLTEIGGQAFRGCWKITSLVLSSEIKVIGEMAFASYPNFPSRLTGDLIFPEGLVSIGAAAFEDCAKIQTISFPSTLQVIGGNAFKGCYGVHGITSSSIELPIVHNNSFDGVPKDNFTLEVPEGAVKRYQADPIWGEFKRISAHYDFSISRPLIRTLNNGKSESYILRVPANMSWSIESKPDWVTISPSSGVGKTEIAVTVHNMADSDITKFNPEMGDKKYEGRSGEIVFLLKDKNYRSRITVEQYSYKNADGDVLKLNSATKGKGVNIVFLGDCYDAKDIVDGKYWGDIQEAFGHLFNVEPFKTYKEYFNVNAVLGVSSESGMGTVYTIRDSKFGSQYTSSGIRPDFQLCYDYSSIAVPDLNPSETIVVVVQNTSDYGGVSYLWEDGSAVVCCPKSEDEYPYDFRGVIQHEVGGHAFGKLADESVNHAAFIQACGCLCCPHLSGLLSGKDLGWYRNLEVTSDMHQVGWAHLIFNPNYSDYVDMYEGGYSHSRGVYRSEAISCMNNNIPYFSAISRQAIVERIMDYAGEVFTLDKFYEKDSDAFGSTHTTKSALIPLENNGQHYAPVIMGAKPEL